MQSPVCHLRKGNTNMSVKRNRNKNLSETDKLGPNPSGHPRSSPVTAVAPTSGARERDDQG